MAALLTSAAERLAFNTSRRPPVSRVPRLRAPKPMKAGYKVPTSNMKYGFFNLKNYKGGLKANTRLAPKPPMLAGGNWA